MVTYPLDEVLLATLVGVVCGADRDPAFGHMSEDRGYNHGASARQANPNNSK